MFYSQLLLSKKGALGIIWMAAHCHKRLKREQVHQTNISSSVDKILDDEVPVVTHRILAFLLLGVVRIYSKKVEYLFQDCHEIVNKLCSSRTGKKGARVEVSQRHYHSITFPRRFELDTFDLGLDQVATGGKVRSHVQDTTNGNRKGHSRSGSFDKATIPIPEANSTAGTPSRDVLEAHHVGWNFVKPSNNKSICLAGVEVFRQTRFSLEDCLEPMVLDEAEKEQLNGNENASPNFRRQIQEEMHDELSHENLRIGSEGPINNMDSHFVVGSSNSRILSLPSIRFALEDRLEPMVLDEAERENLYDGTSNRNTSSDGQDVEFNSVMNQFPNETNHVESLRILHESDLPLESNDAEKREGHDKPPHGAEEEHVSRRTNLQEGEFTQAADNTAAVGPQLKLLEVVTPQSVKCHKPDKFQVPLLSPHSKLQDVGTSEVAAVPTPGRKERARTFNKRKALVDETIVLPNKVLKSWIEDPSDLKRRKRPTPCTPLQVWRAHKLCHGFVEPLCHGISAELTSGLRESYVPEFKSSSGQDVRVPTVEKSPQQTAPVVEEKSPEQAPAVESPVAERVPIAPGTPVAYVDSLRSHEAETVADSNTFETTSSSNEQLGLDTLFQEETSSYAGDSLEKGNDAHSARTRMIASYLSKNFLRKKSREEEQVLNLSHLLAGKTKKESTVMFYEILVLKTQGCIDVQQGTGYQDILVHETPKLKALLK